MERALYKSVDYAAKASKKEFKIVADGNFMWNNFSDKT
ncbi:conserved domain protein [Streptococcus porcinus str. Jelinkova 176]|uniref:Conserved domain protein n=1 Tax=Streptococcus porcinus str. Jelinkova 176 TaxID=873448 RepID=A0ABN0CWW0_STRPO|nr:conserved domain protein [Streptococcus porcinus str. Jelinkova 176]